MIATQEWRKEGYLITTDKEKQDIAAIHRYLTRSTWAAGIDRETVAISVQNSLNFGLFHNGEQVGFARLVTDYATFAYLCDVYVLEEYQGEKLGRWLIACCHAHPVFAKLRRIVLFTSTAPWLYEKFGYQPVNRQNYTWTIARPDIYQNAKKPADQSER
ncbi:N-acetyltransferase [Kosakonia radicincitans DSM 16656]|uniref:GNAT family N-acetyltransferase n=1 Tax=Kosakonia radicincitans TaxID=283686 RepID=UPI0002730876|nr:GNAT family N-acetyltransferase [Kosakonia radicincitans]APG17374.1 histone acetyltransferase [Kosakonia radicincitans]ARD61733.1 N-acetyltransferase [Kosakonia radicincitans DSM 16656]MDD7996331.1 GNAT family N-acetyltransferase [Kosakonia radicincitans]QEM92352.1 GNAT family N-acetyltransferase [Kosakonia radicincitans]SKC22892.1 Predicted N-acetyltransferase YhbS [Kosakonia radicincitans]